MSYYYNLGKKDVVFHKFEHVLNINEEYNKLIRIKIAEIPKNSISANFHNAGKGT